MLGDPSVCSRNPGIEISIHYRCPCEYNYNVLLILNVVKMGKYTTKRSEVLEFYP